MPPPHAPESRARVAAAFALVYLVWGSTYLAIRFALESFDTLTLAGLRFAIAGALLFAWSRWRERLRPSARQWRNALWTGTLLLALSNGLVVWSERRVPSGLAALMVATVPLWMVGFERWFEGRSATRASGWIGMALGLLGVGVLANPWSSLGGQPVDALGAGALLLSPATWAAGSILTRRIDLPRSAPLTTAMQMLCASAVLLVGAAVFERPLGLLEQPPSARASLSLLYLIVFGSLLALSAYTWLLRRRPAGQVATYAYVNPVVALLLGWLLADEPLSPRILVACGLILTAVLLILRAPRAPAAGPRAAAAHESG